MLNESKNQALNYIQNDEILYIPHFFYEWDSETKKMSRIERDIFLDLRTMYFGNATANNGKIDAKDKDLLYYQLGCNTDEEKQSLERLLKAKFKKIGNTYRHTKWDKQIKNIKWAMKNSKHSNVGNEKSNDDSNAMSNAERQKKLKAERKKLLANLQNIGIVLDKDVAMATLRETHAQNLTNMDNNNGNTQSNDDGNASNAQKRANNQNNNQDKNNISLSQAGEIDLKNQQILITNIQQWQAPTLDEIRSILLANDFAGVFTQEIYDQILPKFKNHFENLEITENKRLATEQSRIDRLVAWIKREKITQQPTSTDTTNTPAKKLDPSKTVMLNGLAFEPLPNMTVQQTYQFVQKHKLAYEMSDEAYKRIKQEINWQQFDYQTFLNDFNQQQAVA